MDGDHPRLLIPFRNEEGEVFAYQGRAFGKEQPKYITIKLEDRDKIFGMDKLMKFDFGIPGLRIEPFNFNLNILTSWEIITDILIMIH